MIYSPYHLYEELLTQKFTANFNALSVVDKALKFEIINPDNPRNISLSITCNNRKYLFKQPKINTIASLEPFENEVNYYKNFYQSDEDFFYNNYKKYLILPWIEKDRMEGLKFFVHKKLDTDYSNAFVHNAIASINEFHELSNQEKSKTNFLTNSYSSIEPMYLNILKLFKKAYLSKRFEVVLFPDECDKNRNNVRQIVIEFLKEKEVAKFFLDTIEKQPFTKDCLIHGDMNIHNMRGEISDKFSVIDFEFVCLGDPLWDYVCYIESVFSRYFTNINKEIYKIRFEIFTCFLKGFLGGEDLKEKQNEIKRYLLFLIIYKLKYLINDNSEFAYSEGGTQIVMQSIRKLICEDDTFVDLIINNHFNDTCISYLLAPGCGSN
jgi:hypothetical protein